MWLGLLPILGLWSCDGPMSVIYFSRDTAPEPSSPRAPLPEISELPVFDLPLTVAEAYAAIPHRQVVFDRGASSLPAKDADYLEVMFHLLDQGTRARVVGYRDLYHHGTSSARPVARYEELIATVGALDPPPHLGLYQEAILRALENQRAFFEEWTAAGADFGFRDRIGQHRKVRFASASLQQAYHVLMSKYGTSEPQANRDAFFDVHCALDFL